MRKLVAVIVAFLLASIVLADWSLDLPLDAAAWPLQDNYSIYASNLLAAANERAKATAYQFVESVTWECVGATLKKVTNNIIDYRVAPVTWVENRPWPTGLVVNVTYPARFNWAPISTVKVEVVRYDTVYTNGMWLTNDIVAKIEVPWDLNTVITSVIHSEIVYVNGEFVTNGVYNASITNKVIGYNWVATGNAYDVLKDGMYTNINGAHWPVVGSIPPQTWNGTYYIDNYVPFYTTPIYGTIYIPTSTNVTLDLDYRLYNPATRMFTNVPVIVTYTNYFFSETTGVVGYTQYFDNDAISTPFSYDACTAINVTNSYRVMTNDTSSVPNPALIADIRDMVEELPPYFLDGREGDGAGDFYQWMTNTYYLWDVGGGVSWPDYLSWKFKTNGVLTTYWPSVPAPRKYYMPGMLKWNLLDLYEYTGAGTNLYRIRPKIDINTYVRSGFPYIENNGTFAYNTGVKGWEVGNFTTNTIILFDQTLAYITNNNPQPKLMSEHDIDIDIGTYRWVVYLEEEDVAGGFSSTYWYYDTNDVLVLSTNETWISDINYASSGNRFTPVTNVYSVETDFNGTYTEEYRYFENGAGAYLVPLLPNSADRDYYHMIMSWSGDIFDPITAVGTLRAVGWVLVNDLTTGLMFSTNWATLFGSDLRTARNKIHQAGYPTQVNEYNLGQPSTGPSGYYYPGGYIRPDLYSVGLEYSDARRVAAGSDDRASDRTQQEPYVLDNMKWDTLINWPLTSIDVTAGTNTTTLPSVPVSVVGYYLHTDTAPDALRGYDWEGGDTTDLSTNEVTLTSTGTITHAVALLSIERDTSRAVITFVADGATERQVSAVFDDRIVTNDLWLPSLAWDIGGPAVTDTYFYATTKLVTNSVGVTHRVPVLSNATYVISIDPTVSAINAKYRYYIGLEDIELYNGVTDEGQTLTADFVDSMYLVLNELLYSEWSTVGYDWNSVYMGAAFDYDSWDGGGNFPLRPPTDVAGNNDYHIFTWFDGSYTYYVNTTGRRATNNINTPPTVWVSDAYEGTFAEGAGFGLQVGTVPVRIPRGSTMVATWSVGSDGLYLSEDGDIENSFNETIWFKNTTGTPMDDDVAFHVGSTTPDFTPYASRYLFTYFTDPGVVASLMNLVRWIPNSIISDKYEQDASSAWWLRAEFEASSEMAASYVEWYNPDSTDRLPYPHSILEIDGNDVANQAFGRIGLWPTASEVSRVIDPDLSGTTDVYVCSTFSGGEWDVATSRSMPASAGLFGANISLSFTVLTNFVGTNTVASPDYYHPLDGSFVDLGHKRNNHMFDTTGDATKPVTNSHSYVGGAMDISWIDVGSFSDSVVKDYAAGLPNQSTTHMNHSLSLPKKLAVPYMYNLWFPNVVTRWDFEYQ